jgi:hypothetical protein
MRKEARKLRAADEDVVDGDVDELDNVADDAHDEETNADSLRDADELPLVGLGAAVHEEGAFPEKLSGHVCEFLDVLHGGGRAGEGRGARWAKARRGGFNGERGDCGEVWE